MDPLKSPKNALFEAFKRRQRLTKNQQKIKIIKVKTLNEN